MSLNNTPSANRVHISFFGRCNVGKSSVVNAITNQDLSVVSNIKGTTTDPVYKSFELLPLGAVMIIDTAGIDDFSQLGELRTKKTKQILNKTDIAVLVVDATENLKSCDFQLIGLFKSKNIPYCIVYNKMDLLSEFKPLKDNEIYVSALNDKNIFQLKELIAHLVPNTESKSLVADLINPNDFIVLVVPIDSSAPKGRLILPQQQVIRNILDTHAISVVVRETELQQTLKSLNKKPSLVITDSQVFKRVSLNTPSDIHLTSFSILMARYKGLLDTVVNGVKSIENLKDNDIILI